MGYKKPVASGNGSISKAEKKLGKATPKFGGMGGQHLKSCGHSGPKTSKLD